MSYLFGLFLWHCSAYIDRHVILLSPLLRWPSYKHGVQLLPAKSIPDTISDWSPMPTLMVYWFYKYLLRESWNQYLRENLYAVIVTFFRFANIWCPRPKGSRRTRMLQILTPDLHYQPSGKGPPLIIWSTAQNSLPNSLRRFSQHNLYGRGTKRREQSNRYISCCWDRP